jgi:hypothetical protein
VIPFHPRPQQKQVLEMIFKQVLKRIVILKARQLGFSMLLGIICTDQRCWTTGKQLSLIRLALFAFAGGHWAVLQAIAWAQIHTRRFSTASISNYQS